MPAKNRTRLEKSKTPPQRNQPQNQTPEATPNGNEQPPPPPPDEQPPPPPPSVIKKSRDSKGR